MTSNSLILGNGANVGIGTSYPGGKLTVVGASGQRATVIGDTGIGSSYAGLSVQGTLGISNYSLLGDGSILFVNRPTGGDILFRENNTDQMAIKTGGNVGIGTASPTLAKLQVIGSIFAYADNTFLALDDQSSPRM